MQTKTVLLALIILAIPSVTPVTIRELDLASQVLKDDDIMISLLNVDRFVDMNINYTVYWFPRGVYYTWKDKEGDCTDTAMMKCYLLNRMNYKCRTVHGVADGELHDWIELKVNNTWYSNEAQWFKKLERKGVNPW